MPVFVSSTGSRLLHRGAHGELRSTCRSGWPDATRRSLGRFSPLVNCSCPDSRFPGGRVVSQEWIGPEDAWGLGVNHSVTPQPNRWRDLNNSRRQLARSRIGTIRALLPFSLIRLPPSFLFIKLGLGRRKHIVFPGRP